MPTNITGTLVDIGTNLITSGIFVRFQLKGTQGVQPVVTGVGALAQGSGAGREWFYDFVPSAGVISGSVYSTRDATGLLAGEITVNSNGTACWYEISIYRNGKKYSSVHTHAKTSATLDIATASPLTSNPLPTSLTNDAIYAQLSGGNQPFTGPITAPVIIASTGFRQGTMTVFRMLQSDGTNYVTVVPTGTGVPVCKASPALTTPDIGAATATTINKVTITAPASSAVLTILNGKVLTIDNSIELAGTDNTKHTFPNNTGTVAELNLAQTWTAAQTFNATALGLKPTFQSFTTAGTATFTIPAGITALKVTVIAGGGAGGGATATNNGGGGASGGVGVKWLSSLTPGNTLAVTVGAGGTGVSAAGGNSGGNSSVASGTQSITTITTNGGGGGASTGATSAGGTAPAAGSGGDSPLNVGGNPGQPNVIANVGGNGGPGPFGGAGGGGGGGAGNPAAGPGSGGGGAGAAGNAAGGNGSNGTVIFEWVT